MRDRTVLHPGFIAFHGNRAEDLAQVMINWIRRHPLSPLEEEVILVQSNGMAEWVKMELARMGGVCAATRVELPSRFLWRSYRQVLGPDAVPRDSALDKMPMVWRLMQLLPALLAEPDFVPVAGFLKADEPDRLLQLASQLADLFDQYQNYRADWLDAWAQRQDQLRLASGVLADLPADQRWQPQLWRALLQTLNEEQQHTIRPSLHQRVLAHLAGGAPPRSPVARRVLVFGMSQIPWTTLQALAALSAHSQVILAIPNPCRYYWGDIMAGRELLHSLRRRQPRRNDQDLSAVPLEDMHQHAHPLLTSWGRQGRDFIRQLDVFDDAEQSRLNFGESRIDLFDDTPEAANTPWLRQVQNRIRDLTPLSEHNSQPLADDDRSIIFHSAHSRVRELEILHDQLLRLLANTSGIAPLNPRDIVVMVPDVAQMAPAIQAVFGRYKRQDARFIPFDIADLGSRENNPVLASMDWLLSLPQQRCTMSELVGLLEVEAIASRFGIAQASLPVLTRWMTGAGIRWGLNASHRVKLGLGVCGEQNSAWFGLQRMLLGFASGADTTQASWPGLSAIEPYAEVGGLEAELAGSLAHLLQALLDWWTLASTEASPAVWVERFRQLLTSLVKADRETDRQAINALEDALLSWQQACEQADFSADIPLQVAHSAWLQTLDQPRLNQRFRAGGVTFCTLMPMRAIPFEVVCLLGMNDGDYPRRGMRSDFDLMGLPGTARPGDRSRRDDDRQLMLEALLSARRLLYVSWCGHNVRDNSAQAPSVLVAQLRDYLAAGWSRHAVDQRTTAHPLQPFSRRYFENGSDLLTYAREWRAAHAAPLARPDEEDQAPALHAFVPNPQVPLSLNQLTRFLRHPVKAFFRQRLMVVFEDDEQESFDEECFAVDALHEYGLIDQLLTLAITENPTDTGPAMQRALARLRKAGELPHQSLGDLQQQALEQTLGTLLRAWHATQARFPQPAQRQSIQLAHHGVVLEDWIDQLWQSRDPTHATPPLAWLSLEPGKLLKNGKKPVIRPDRLLTSWIRGLAIAAAGCSAQGVVVARDGVLEISPMAQDEATTTLQMLLDVWQQGMNTPLPLPLKTALAWLANPDKPASQTYEGDFQQRGEVEEPCMARIFPDYETLCADGRFESLAQLVYQPLLQWAARHVNASFHDADLPLAEANE
ncbi:MAG: hypothetical protein RLZZ371_155 [Pseudomonadota bacterium]